MQQSHSNCNLTFLIMAQVRSDDSGIQRLQIERCKSLPSSTEVEGCFESCNASYSNEIRVYQTVDNQSPTKNVEKYFNRLVYNREQGVILDAEARGI